MLPARDRLPNDAERTLADAPGGTLEVGGVHDPPWPFIEDGWAKGVEARPGGPYRLN